MQRYYNTDEDKTQKKTETPLDVLIALKAEYDKAEKVRQETDTAYGKAKGNYFDIQGSYCISSDPDEGQRDFQEVLKAEQKMEEAKQVHEEAKRKAEEAYRLCQEAVRVYQEAISTNPVNKVPNNKKRKRMSEANTENTTKKRRVELAKDSSPNEIQEPEDRYLKNIQLAKEAIEYCRKKIPIENSSTQPRVTDKEKIRHLSKQVSEARARKWEKSELVFNILMYPDNRFLMEISKNKKTSKKYKVGNCRELSCLAMNYLRKKNIQRAEMVSIVGSDHVLVLEDRDLKGRSTWGKSCVILDVLNEQFFAPSEIYSKLKCYRFDFNSEPPHILTDFTVDHQLFVEGEISNYQNDSENLERIKQFYEKLDKIAVTCIKYLDRQKYNELKRIIDESIQYSLNEFANLDLERLLGRKIKQIIRIIQSEEKENQDKIFNEILIDLMLNTYEAAALHMAVDNGYFEIIEELLKRGVNPYLVNQEGCLPLHLAAREGHIDIVKLLLNLDANQSINFIKSDGCTALHIAVQKGYVEIVEELLKRGANPYLATQEGYLPLHLAASEGHANVIELLLKYDANNSINCVQSSDIGVTPLYLAALNGRFNIVKILLKNRADCTLTFKTTQEQLLSLCANYSAGIQNNIRQLIDQKQRADNSLIEVTPLEIAWAMGHNEIVKLLTDACIKRNSISQNNLFTASSVSAVNSKPYPVQTQTQTPMRTGGSLNNAS